MKRFLNALAALMALLIFVPAVYAANADNPNGCKPAGLFGQLAEPFQPFETAAAQTIVEGDPVKLDGSGQIVIGTATDSTLLGFARTAVTASSAGDLIYVYSDPLTVFECQCSGTFAITMIGDAVDLEGSTGAFEVNENATTYRPLRILNYNPNDSVGANTRVYVQLVMSTVGGGASGVFDDLAVLDDLTVADDAGITGTATVGTLTDGTMTVTAGDFTAVGDIGCDNVTGTATLQGVTLTDGTATVTGGDIASVGAVGCDSVTATAAVQGLSLTDGVATMTLGDLAAVGAVGCDSVTATAAVEGLSLTDGVATMTLGDLAAVGAVGCDSVTATAAIEGLSLTDGTATLTAGAITAATDITMSGDLDMGGHKDGMVLIAGSFDYPKADGSEWWGSAGAAALPQNITAKSCYLNIQGLKVGDEIVSYTIFGTAVENAALTLDVTLIEVAQDGTESDPTGDGTNAITQIDAGGDFSAQAVFTAPYTVATKKAYRLKVLGTTGAVDSIAVQGSVLTANIK
jgi:hypothetical protein